MLALRYVKDSSELVLDGVKIEPEYWNKGLKSVTFTDAQGRVLKIDVEYSLLRALVPDSPQKKGVFVLTGTVPVLGTPITEAFEYYDEAHKRKSELESANVIENAEIKTGEVEIPF